MKEYFKAATTPLCRAESVVQGEKYRITVLTAGILRLEYSEQGRFVDEASQMVWNRDFPTPDYVVKEEDGLLEIITDRVHLFYDKKKFTSHGLCIQGKKRQAWHYGDTPDNLGGTVRTLDMVDGACPLEPGILSQMGYAVIDDSKTILLRDDAWVGVRDNQGEDLYFFCYEDDYREAVKDFYRLCGRTPMLPRYALGNWWSRYYVYSEKTYLELMDRFEKEQIPFTVAVIDMDWHVTEVDPKYGEGWTGYSWNRELFPDPERFLKNLRDRGMKVTLNVHPADGIRAFEDMYGEMADAMGVDKEKELPVSFDITDKDFLEKYFEIVHHPHEEAGVDFWWIDWQQGGSTRVEGLDPLWMLNHYHFLDNRRDGKRPMTFSRYAGPGSHRYPVGFSGDSIVTWDSLDFQPYFTATASNIGFGWWSHDIGGHMFGYRDDELELRWYQLGVFSPINRLHSTQNEFMGKEPWRFPMEIHRIMNKFLRLRHRMIPYLYTMNHRSWKDGEPLVQPLYYEYPKAREAYELKNGYLFGSELMVYPVTTPTIDWLKAAEIPGWLPAGTWIDVFTGMIYKSGEDRKVTFYRGLDSMPVLAKGGAIVPLTDEIAGNLVEKNPQSLRIRVYAGADGHFDLYEDDNTTCGYENGHCAITSMDFTWEKEQKFHMAAVTGEAGLVPEKRDFVLEFWGVTEAPVEVCSDGQEISCETAYDEVKNVLTVKVPAHPVNEELTVRFTETVSLGHNHTEQRIHDLLDGAEMSFALKEEMMNAVRREQNPVRLAGNLYAMKIEEKLLGAILEILCAKTEE